MDSGGRSASGVDQEGSSSRISNKNGNRHTPQQIQYLEAYFKNCAYPDEKQRKLISEHLELEHCQIKFWFQNRRTQMKTQFERADYNSVHWENERINSENLAMKEALRNVLCHACGGPSISRNEHQINIEKLQLENANLKKEYELVATQVAQLMGRSVSEVNSWVSTGSRVDFAVGSVSCTGMRGSLGYSSNSFTISASQSEPISNIEKSVMVETAVAAMDELLKVLQSNKPLWKYNNGRYSLNRDCYEKVFMRPHHFKPNIIGKLESSKDSCDVAINAIVLVNMILDSSMWLDLFPTLVTKAETSHVVETGMLGNRSGSLHLMHEVMHTLSPLLAPREFYFIRYCQQVQIDTWVIVDVSYGTPRGNDDNLMPHCRKLPSGLMIQGMPDGHSKVTWVELVEVDDRASTHQLYRDLVTSGLVFGAERWISTLKQMCERAVLSNAEPANTQEATWSAEGKRSLMDLSHRMVKLFCATLNMPINKLDVHHESETDNSGVRVSTRMCTDPCKPEGVVVCATTSLWFPLCPQHVFAFFQDRNMRSQWDFLSHGKPVTEIVLAASGRHPGNSISVYKPVAPDESHIVILEESFVDLLGYYLVFAPLELTAINKAVAGLESSNTPVLPSGFVISTDGHGISPKYPNNKSGDEDGGSLLTVAFQSHILFNDSAFTEQKHMEVVVDMTTVITSTVEKIKAALTPSSSSSKTGISPASII